MLKSEPLGNGSGSGGELETGHVICPACSHNFPAIPMNARERIAELEDALHRIRGWREIGSADTHREKLSAIEGICDRVL